MEEQHAVITHPYARTEAGRVWRLVGFFLFYFTPLLGFKNLPPSHFVLLEFSSVFHLPRAA